MPPKKKICSNTATSASTNGEDGTERSKLLPAKDWQNLQATLPKCLEHMLDNEDQFSIKFLVGAEKKPFKAHKLILAARSPVFYSMFFGPLAQKEEEITLTDIEPEGFRKLLRFVKLKCNIKSTDNLVKIFTLYFPLHDILGTIGTKVLLNL